MDERSRYQSAGLKWLFEMELLRDPQLINNLKFNILAVSESIKECEFLMDQDQKAILIYLELSWWGGHFKAKEIEEGVTDIIGQLLPSFRSRVILDRSILELALTKLKEQRQGVPNEVSNTDPNDVVADANRSESEGELSETSDLLPDQEEQTEPEVQEGDGVVESDLQGESKIQDPS